MADAAVAAIRDGHVVASAHTNARGYFHMTVAPGRYTVQATNAGGYQSTASKVVTVATDKAVYVRLVVDSPPAATTMKRRANASRSLSSPSSTACAHTVRRFSMSWLRPAA